MAKKKAVKIDDIVFVTWVDSSGFEQYWVNNDKVVQDVLQCESIGRLILITDHSVVLCQSWNEDQVGGVIEIPTVAITNIYVVA